MSILKSALLLTGKPGSGKTAVIKTALSRATKTAGGFYTEEIRVESARQGFRIITLDGKSAVLSHVGIRSHHSVGKYGVDVTGVDHVAVPAIREAIRNKDIVVIDEIGRMELFSTDFEYAVREALESKKKVLGTIMLASHPRAEEIKRRPEVEIMNVTRDNHSEIIARISAWLN